MKIAVLLYINFLLKLLIIIYNKITSYYIYNLNLKLLSAVKIKDFKCFFFIILK